MGWKRKDIKTYVVLSAVCTKNTCPIVERLQGIYGAPEKVIYSALFRELDAGRIDYGVNIRQSWITQKGRDYMEMATNRITREQLTERRGLVNE